MVQLPVTGARYAIVLGGGRSARMGHDKRDLVLDGRSLLARATDACVGRQVIVAVTPALPHDVDPTGVQRVLEDPPFGGPVAGLAAGLAALPSIYGFWGAWLALTLFTLPFPLLSIRAALAG